MVWPRAARTPRIGRSPHSRGDGPIGAPCCIRSRSFSPLAWGWSANGFRHLLPHWVLPTRVGIVRPAHQCRGLHKGSPTRVGMVRIIVTLADSGRGSPHSRGDGPPWQRDKDLASQFSPLAWGWSPVDGRCIQHPMVLPTRVGMVRFKPVHEKDTIGSPHSRGDGPEGHHCAILRFQFSPLAWGWSDYLAPACSDETVLPTRVGMVRRARGGLVEGHGSPHSRGDGPGRAMMRSWGCRFSPLAWGWSALPMMPMP
ncbi:MAG: hypothetical protein JWO89_3730 [Verrucomicrobiaceae bacterium]|nr:hypothetical protein [Verrucomicrobiaceae bacterium]